MQKHVHLVGILFATIFGFTFMFSKIAFVYVTPIGLIAYRFLLAFLVFEFLRRIKVIKVTLHKSNIKLLLLVAFFQPVSYFLFETFGLSRTSSSEAGMMIALIPVFVTMLSALILKEKPTWLQVGFIALSVSGVIYIQLSKSGEGLQVDILGFSLLLAAVISAALFNIASRNAGKTMKPQDVTYIMMLTGAVVFNIIYIIQLSVEQRISDYVTNLFHLELVIPILYLGLAASILAFFLVNYALSRLPAHVTSIYANLSTIVAIIAGATILNERLYFYHFIGSAMIIIGVYGTVLFSHKQKKKIQKPLNSKSLLK
ncbi:MAG: DMT family transporter [Acholeplasmataceae bacterium]|nr:DMT family transporter [Acholeplasmataceae bacterium]